MADYKIRLQVDSSQVDEVDRKLEELKTALSGLRVDVDQQSLNEAKNAIEKLRKELSGGDKVKIIDTSNLNKIKNFSTRNKSVVDDLKISLDGLYTTLTKIGEINLSSGLLNKNEITEIKKLIRTLDKDTPSRSSNSRSSKGKKSDNYSLSETESYRNQITDIMNENLGTLKIEPDYKVDVSNKGRVKITGVRSLEDGIKKEFTVTFRSAKDFIAAESEGLVSYFNKEISSASAKASRSPSKQPKTSTPKTSKQKTSTTKTSNTSLQNSRSNQILNLKEQALYEDLLKTASKNPETEEYKRSLNEIEQAYHELQSLSKQDLINNSNFKEAYASAQKLKEKIKELKAEMLKASTDSRNESLKGILSGNGNGSYDQKVQDLEMVSGNKLESYKTKILELKNLISEANQSIDLTPEDLADDEIFEKAKANVEDYRIKIDALIKDLQTSKWDSGGLVKMMGGESIGEIQSAMEKQIKAVDGVDKASIKFKQSLNAANGEVLVATYNVNTNSGAVKQMKLVYNDTTKAIKEFTVGEKQAATGVNGLMKNMSTKASGFLASLASFATIQRAFQVVKEGVGVVTDLDTAMVEVRKVSSATEEQYDSFRQTIKGMAKDVASTNAELMNSTADWLRTGESLADATTLAKSSAVYVNVGDGIDIDTATSDMVTAMKAYNIEAENSMHIVDTFNEVGNTYAITSAGIGESLSRSASALAEAGNTFEESVAMATAMNEIVQNSENVGSSLKILSLRLRGAKVEIEEAGESTDGMATSTAKLQEKIKALTNIDGSGGFDIMEDANTMKSTIEIMDGIANVYERMSDIDQAALLELIAGKNRANNIAALLQNWEQVGKVLETIEGSEGSAYEENEAILDSIEGRTKILSAAMEEFWSTLINEDAVKATVSGLTKIAEAATSVIDKFGLLGLAGAAVFTNGAKNTIAAATGNQDKYGKVVGALISDGKAYTAQYQATKTNLSEGQYQAAAVSFDLMTQHQQKAMLTSKKLEDSYKSQLGALLSLSNSSKEYNEQEISSLLTMTSLNDEQQLSVLKSLELYSEVGDQTKTVTAARIFEQAAIDDQTRALAQYMIQAEASNGLSKEQVDNLLKQAAARKLSQKQDIDYIKNIQEAGSNLISGIVSTVSAHPILAGLVAASAIIGGIVFLVDKANVTLEEQRKVVSEIRTEAEKAQEEFETLNSSLEENQNRINELSGKETLTFVEKSELEKLREANELLRIQVQLSEEASNIEQRKLGNASYELVKKYGASDWSVESVNQVKDLLSQSNALRDSGQEEAASFVYSMTDTPAYNELQGNLANYLLIQDDIKNAIEQGNAEEEAVLRESLASQKETIYTMAQELVQAKSDMEIVYQDAINHPESVRSDTDKDIISTYEGISEQIRNVYEVIDPAAWNNIRFDEIFTTDGIEKTKDELIELASAGNLTMNTLMGFPNLMKALDGADLILTDGQSAAKAFMEQINAMAGGDTKTGINLEEVETRYEQYIRSAKNFASGLDIGDKIQQYALEVGMSIDDFINKFSKLESAEDYISSLSSAIMFSIDDATEEFTSFSSGIESLNSALSEQENGAVSTDTYNSLIAANQKYSAAVEETSMGWRINQQKAAEIARESARENLESINEQQDAQVALFRENLNQLNELNRKKEEYEAISKDTSAIELEIQGFEDAQNEIKSTINALNQLESQYKSAISTYGSWVNAQETPNEGAIYDSIYAGIESTQELWEKGLVGTDDFRSFVDLMTNSDMSGASSAEIADAYTGAIARAKKYFTEDASGAKAFVRDLDAINDEYVKIGENGETILDFSDLDIPDIAKEFNMSEDAINAMILKLRDFGFDISFDSTEEKIADIDKKLDDLEKERKVALDAGMDTTEIDKKITEYESQKLQLEADVYLTSEGEVDTEYAQKKYNEAKTQSDASYKAYVESAGKYVSSMGGEDEAKYLEEYNQKRSKAFADQMKAYNIALKNGLEVEEPDWAINFDNTSKSLKELQSDANSANEKLSLLGKELNGEKLEFDLDAEDFSAEMEKAGEYYKSFFETTEDGDVELKADVDYAELEYASDILSYFVVKEQEAENNSSVVMTADVSNYNEDAAAVITTLQEIKTLSDKLAVMQVNPTVSDEDITSVQNDLDSAYETLLSLDANTVVNMGVDKQSLDTVIADIESNGIDVNVGLKDRNDAELTIDANTKPANTAVSNLVTNTNAKSATIGVKANTSSAASTISAFLTKKRAPIYIDIKARTGATGSAVAAGTAFSGGTTNAYSIGTYRDWAVPQNQTALVNEIGNEGIVRDGKFSIINGGAQFVQLKKGDIIFNHKQTEELLKYGHILGQGRGRLIGGKTFANGTANAYVSGSGGWFGGASSVAASGSGSGSGSSSNTAAVKSNTNATTSLTTALNNFEKWFDWIEVKLDRMASATEKAVDAIDLFYDGTKNLYRQYSDVSKQNLQVQEAINANLAEQAANEAAAKKYEEKANSFRNQKNVKKVLTDDIIKKIVNGTIDINSYSDNTKKAIEDYQGLYEKALSAKETIEELKKQQRELELMKLENIQNYYENQADYYNALIDASEAEIELNRAISGSKDIFFSNDKVSKEIDLYSSILEALRIERASLSEQMDDLISRGVLEEGTEDWYSWQSAIADVNAEIAETTQSMADLRKEQFDAISDFYDMRVDFKDTLDSQAQTIIEYMKTMGVESVGGKSFADYYAEAIAGLVGGENSSDSKISYLREQLGDLTAEFQAQMSSGVLEEFSQQWYEMQTTIQEVTSELYECEQAAEEYRRELYELNVTAADYGLERIEASNKAIEGQITLYETLGKTVSSNSYRSLIENSNAELQAQEAKKQLIQNEIDRISSVENFDSSSSYYNELLGELEDCNSSIIETIQAQEEWNQAIYELDISKIDQVVDRLSATQQIIESIIDFHDAQFADKNEQDYLDLILNADEQIAQYEQRAKLVREEMDRILANGGDETSVRYAELSSELEEIRSSIVETKTEQEKWNDEILDIRIQRLEDEKEELEKQNSAIDRRIKLEKALDDLAEARAQKNKLVYHEGIGFVYEADQQAIQDAQEALDDAYYDEMLSKFDDAIDALEDLKKEFNLYDYDGNKIGSSGMQSAADQIVDTVLSKKDGFSNLVPYEDYYGIKLPDIQPEVLYNVAPISTVTKQFEVPAMTNIENVSTNNVQNVVVNIGDINLPNVQNAEDFAKEFSRLLSNYLQQEVGK